MNTENSPINIRDTLFGDMPLEKWQGPEGQSWQLFQQAKQQIDAHDKTAATETFQKILNTPNLETRHYIQAYNFLAQIGHPYTGEKKLLGVIVEVGLEAGEDIVVAYADHSARYFNFSGKSIIWDHPDNSLSENINQLLLAGHETMSKIGPWEGPRPAPVSEGTTRINLLTTHGLHFGEGPTDIISADPMGEKIFTAAFDLMQALMVQK